MDLVYIISVLQATTIFPDGDVVFRYDFSSTGLPPNWKVIYLSKSISKEELKKEYPHY